MSIHSTLDSVRGEIDTLLQQCELVILRGQASDEGALDSIQSHLMKAQEAPSPEETARHIVEAKQTFDAACDADNLSKLDDGLATLVETVRESGVEVDKLDG